ncbi:uncharacterized protein EMH_0072130 [Eimeria mitis]|uniref:Uncharacterized protein n=1 Tax=Eimeria mitis TaxID=44415 RepID=U6KBG5_9EIME|nr:uncharacterized protein EMH_0072130 [Eimeria mitis]CDJ35299.1 hypothetical protein EMH_0072130 [Eimeria mitis]
MATRIGGRASGCSVWEGVGARFGSLWGLCDAKWAGWLGVTMRAREAAKSGRKNGLREPETECVCSAKVVVAHYNEAFDDAVSVAIHSLALQAPYVNCIDGRASGRADASIQGLMFAFARVHGSRGTKRFLAS